MRIAVLLIAVLVLAPAFSPGADGDLASALLAAKNDGERAALLSGHSSGEIASALDSVEKEAAARLAAKDYPNALNAYQVALALARNSGAEAKLPLLFRRIGVCQASLGEMEPAIATYREGVAASEKAGDNAMLIENLHGLALNLQRVGEYREALPLCQREYDLAEKSGSPDAIMHALTTYEEVLAWLGHLKDSLAMAERAYEVSAHSSQPADHDLMLANLAMVYGSLGDYDTSLRLLQSLPSPNANSLNAIAIVQMHLHRTAEAEASYRAAIAKATSPADWRLRSSVLVDLGILLHSRMKLAEARASVEEGLAIARAHDDRASASSALSELSVIVSDANDAANGLDKAEESLRLARESEDPARITDAFVAQAHAFEAAGRNKDARGAYAEAIQIAEGERADAPASAAGLDGEVMQLISTYQYAIGHEILAGDAAEALRLADRAKARVLLDMLDRGRPGFDALADPQERADERQMREEVAGARRTAVTRPSAASQAALETALRKEQDFDVRLYGRHPELVLQRAAAPDLSPADLGSLVPNRGVALLSYFMLRDSVALFVVRAGEGPGAPSVKVFRLPDSAKLDALVHSFRLQIAARDLDYRTTAKALYAALIAPAEDALRGADRWILSPDGALWDVPFQALMDSGGKHLLETHALAYAPSFSVLRELRGRPAPASPREALLAVANPAVAGAAPLPEASREASAIAALYGPGRSTLLAGDRASAALFRENAGRAGVIHIASHAETETNYPLDSFLLLAPEKASSSAGATPAAGALTARDLLGMRLHASLVVLSACETARGKIGQGDGVMGLGWAVLAAGARASVLSQWKVDSGATSDLMIDFHRRLTAPGSVDKAEALRQASLDTMRSPGRLHPFYWAGFIVVGDAR
jgi:CHAT domain-containing protein